MRIFVFTLFFMLFYYSFADDSAAFAEAQKRYKSEIEKYSDIAITYLINQEYYKKVKYYNDIKITSIYKCGINPSVKLKKGTFEIPEDISDEALKKIQKDKFFWRIVFSPGKLVKELCIVVIISDSDGSVLYFTAKQ